jgi:hypothetical protein
MDTKDMKNTMTLSLHVTRFMLFTVSLFLFGYNGLLQAQTTRFVKSTATGTGDGSSWSNASDDLQLMINNSVAGDSIFVATGTYIPNRPGNNTGTINANNRDNAFVLKTDVKIYGGFAGTEASVAERILQPASPSVLSGDIGTANDSTDNCYHVVIASGPAGNALMDGFTIAGGNAGLIANSSITVNGNPIGRLWGGGLYCYRSAPLIRNCIFSGNAADYGGGIYNSHFNAASTTYVNCIFSYNNARRDGGGMYNSNSLPIVTNCTFSYNTTGSYTIASGNGGGMFNSGSSPAITGCTFNNNTGGSSGGGVYNSSSSPVIANCTFSNNRGSIFGGGIVNWRNSSVSVTGCIFNNNVAEDPITGSSSGGGIANIANTSCNIARCVFLGNKAAYGGGISNTSHAVVEGCRFEGNEAWKTGGGANNEGTYNASTYSVVFTNCTFTGNKSAMGGGGIFNMPTTVTVITNCTLSGNSDVNNGSFGGGIHNNAASPVITSSIIWGNGSGIINQGAAAPIVSYSIVQGGYTGTGNSAADPTFVHAPSHTGAPFTGGDYSLQNCSPAINAGNIAPTNTSSDVDAQPRVQAGRVDMGAYESPFHAATANIVMADTVITAFQLNMSPTSYATRCNNLAAAITGDGTATSVQGNTTVKVWMATVQPADFVKRHFEITPQAVDPATATGTVTLYFTQADFDDFNAVNTIQLPQGPADATGLSHLRIEKRSGTSSDNTGLPGSYTGTVTVINPDDANIVWNAAALRWEVSFAVNGFSGWFVKSSNIPLPLTLVSFTAAEKNCITTLQWITTHEINVSHFEAEQSTDGIVFSAIKTIPAKNTRGENRYAVAVPVTQDNIFYRLKMMDVDGKTRYSKVAVIRAACATKVIVSPNPARDKIYVRKAAIGSHYVVHDHTGKRVGSGRISSTGQEIQVAHLAAGVYYINLFMHGGTRSNIRFTKQ